ncbi:MAG TPA: PD-(D/E)XK nuclease family protein [Pirellulaceae bacterium]|nr:PD-(D/E)XK nuclease family protein [Pirellulaceae bacterium]
MKSVSNESSLAALERFVVESDELLQLEEAIGRFNIFDSLGIARVEIRHSNFLAWLLDPNESHGQGALFLTAVLMDLLRRAPVDKRPLSPIDLDGAELRGVEIRREWHNIDLLILCREPQFLIAIENKVDGAEREDQLDTYKRVVATQFPEWNTLFVFLTREGVEAKSEIWVPYSYADLHGVLTRTRKANEKSIGSDVLVFLDHYLRLIGSRFMDDPTIDDLCKRIYQNHRQALDLIWERIGEGTLTLDVATFLEIEPQRWTVINRTTKHVNFVPTPWLTWLPPLGSLPRADTKHWMIWVLDLLRRKCRIRVLVRPCKDKARRMKVVECLTKSGNPFGFKISGKAADQWTTVFSATIDEWNEDEGPDKEKLLSRISVELAELENRMADVQQALAPALKGVK